MEGKEIDANGSGSAERNYSARMKCEKTALPRTTVRINECSLGYKDKREQLELDQASIAVHECSAVTIPSQQRNTNLRTKGLVKKISWEKVIGSSQSDEQILKNIRGNYSYMR
jgi:hypothetical protein